MPRGVMRFDRVRVRAVLRAAHLYDGWWANKRPPRFGDVGTVVEVLRGDDAREVYVVECIAPDGSTIWLSEMLEEELILQN